MSVYGFVHLYLKWRSTCFKSGERFHLTWSVHWKISPDQFTKKWAESRSLSKSSNICIYSTNPLIPIGLHQSIPYNSKFQIDLISIGTLQLDLGATLVYQSDPTWYKSDPKSTTCTLNDLRRLGQKTTDFPLQVDFLHGTLLFIFVYCDSVVRS